MRTRKRKSLTAPSPQAAECLETRQLLTGQLLVSEVGGQLRIIEMRGQHSTVEVRRDGDNTIVWGRDGTTVNGREYEYFDNEDFDRLYIALGSGNDSVKLHSSTNLPLVLSDINIDVGGTGGTSDADSVEFDGVIGNTISIKTEGSKTPDDIDTVTLSNLNAQTSLAINTGDDNDTVDIDFATLGRLNIDTDRSISDSHSGDDTVTLRNVEVFHNARIFTSGANGDNDHDNVNVSDMEIGGNFETQLGSDLDGFFASAVEVDGFMSIIGGAGTEVIRIEDSDIGGELSAHTNGGNDRITVEQSIAESMRFVTGANNDTVVLNGNSAAIMFIDTGDHSDQVDVRDNWAWWFYANGGSGNNTLVDFDNRFMNRATGGF